MDRPLLSVVMPSYRQATTICHELDRLHVYLGSLVPSHEIILVIDGDEDQTRSCLLARGWFPELRVECFPHNQGKGIALRHGLRLARGHLVAFIDAGGDVDYAELRRFLAAQELYEADVVIGSKRHSLSDVSYPRLRRVYSRTYQLLNRLLFRLRVRDTQVGMKLFRREVLEAVLPRLLVKKFAFDLELLVVANHLGFRRIVEAPVRITLRFSSSISWRAAAQALWDTLAVFYRLRLRHWYDTAHLLETHPRPENVRLQMESPSRMPAKIRMAVAPAQGAPPEHFHGR